MGNAAARNFAAFEREIHPRHPAAAGGYEIRPFLPGHLSPDGFDEGVDIGLKLDLQIDILAVFRVSAQDTLHRCD